MVVSFGIAISRTFEIEIETTIDTTSNQQARSRTMKILSIANVKTKFLVNMNNFSYDININQQHFPDIAIDCIILRMFILIR